MAINPLVKKLGISAPIFLAPMAGPTASTDLVAAISNAGGLGMLGAAYMSPFQMAEAIVQIRKLTIRPFGVNLLTHRSRQIPEEVPMDIVSDALEPYCRELKIPLLPSLHAPTRLLEKIEIIIARRVSVFSFAFGLMDDFYIDRLKKKGIFTIGTCTSPAEAAALEATGIDAIVAQGIEAGGHRGGFHGESGAQIGLLSLIPQVVDAVTVPVIASGGIADRRGVRAALVLGASGVSVGTAFLTAHESTATASYKNALLNAHPTDSVITRVFSGRSARGLRNRFIEQMTPLEGYLPRYPTMHEMTALIRRTASDKGCTDMMSLWAGQSAGLCVEASAWEIFEELLAGFSGIPCALCQ